MAKYSPSITRPRDCSGDLEDGSHFDNINDLKRLLLRDEKTLARTFASQLLIYATGAPISASDQEEIDSILQQVESKQYAARSMIQAIVQSRLFLQK